MVVDHVGVVRKLHQDAVVGTDCRMGTLLERSSFDLGLAVGASHAWSFRVVDSMMHRPLSRGRGLWRDA